MPEERSRWKSRFFSIRQRRYDLLRSIYHELSSIPAIIRVIATRERPSQTRKVSRFFDYSCQHTAQTVLFSTKSPHLLCFFRVKSSLRQALQTVSFKTKDTTFRWCLCLKLMSIGDVLRSSYCKAPRVLHLICSEILTNFSRTHKFRYACRYQALTTTDIPFGMHVRDASSSLISLATRRLPGCTFSSMQSR